MISGAISLARNTVIPKQTANRYSLCGAVMMARRFQVWRRVIGQRDVYLIKWRFLATLLSCETCSSEELFGSFLKHLKEKNLH